LDSTDQRFGHANQESLSLVLNMRLAVLKTLSVGGVITLCMLPLFGVKANDAALGREIYQDTCAVCHGRDMVSSGLVFDLRKFPLTEFDRFQNTVMNGKPPGMPGWRSQLSTEDVRAIWDYVKTGG
jgi:mono/diheme cytochrome c family protein